MAKKYEVAVRFTKRVSQKQLVNAVKQATKAKVKGFGLDNIGTNKLSMEVPRATSKPRRKSRKKKGGKK